MVNLNFKKKNLVRQGVISLVMLASMMLYGLQPSSAQDQTNIFVPKHHFIKSVDAWNFMRQISQDDGVSVNPYTGAMSTNIPIFNYSDKDFNIPISVSFVNEGHIPNIPAGSVGAGWALNVGGLITREVRGIPDEYIPANTYSLDVPPNTKYSDYPQTDAYGYYELYSYLKIFSSAITSFSKSHS